MKKSELRKCVSTYKELSEEITELEAQQEVIATRIKKHLGSIEEEKLDNMTIRYKTVTSNRFDGKTFQEKYRDLYTQYLKPSVSRRFSIS